MAEAPADDPLGALRRHVREAQAAAERLARETIASGGAPRGPGASGAAPGDSERAPPMGWDSTSGQRQASAELQALVELVESLRSMLPDELREQVNELVRQLLLLMRAIIDWLVARIERGEPGRELAVEDIPIV